MFAKTTGPPILLPVIFAHLFRLQLLMLRLHRLSQLKIMCDFGGSSLISKFFNVIEKLEGPRNDAWVEGEG